MKSKFLLKLLAIGAVALSVTLQSCTKDDVTPNNTTKNYHAGVFITNEGPFQSGTGSVSFWGRDGVTRDNHIFDTINGFPLGNIVQSIAVYYGKAYVVVNNANKVEVTDAVTFQSKGSITGLELPRFFIAANEQKGYVSEWVSFGAPGRISVVDLTTNTVTATIPVGIMPDKMIIAGGKLYVVNSNDTTVSVINTQTNSVENTITVGDWPCGIQADLNGNLWVLCAGIPSWTGSAATSPALVKFNPNSPNAQVTFNFGTPDNNPSRLAINGSRSKLYYLYNSGVYEFDINASALSSSPVINRYFYGLGVDPVDGNIYATDAADFVQTGKVIRYNTSFTAVDSLSTDVAPSEFWFVQ